MQVPDALTDGTVAPVQLSAGIGFEFKPDRTAVTIACVLHNLIHQSWFRVNGKL
jgi:hypothetical protein